MANLGSGGSAYNAVLISGASVSTSTKVVGNAALLLVSASSQYVTIPTFPTSSQGLSISLWFQSTSSNSINVRLFDFGTLNPQESFGIGINSGLLRAFRCVSTTCVFPNSEFLYLNVNDGLWRHLVWTMSPTGDWYTYLNGLIFSSYSGQGYVVPAFHPDNYVGKVAATWGTITYLNGAIDEFFLFQSVLTPSQVQTLHQKGKYEIAI